MSTLIERLHRDPVAVAQQLAQEDPWILQRLHQDFDRSDELQSLIDLATAIEALGGRLAPSQRAKLTRVREAA